MLPRIALALLAGLGFVTAAIADTYCSTDVPCEIGCCGRNNVCGLGPDYCAEDKCISNCGAKAECNPGHWADKYVNATTCPLNVCCSDFGFCGTTEEFCGNKTVTRPSYDPRSYPTGCLLAYLLRFVSIDPDTFEVIPAVQGDKQLYPQLEALQARDLGQELWLSIGGWDFSDDGQPMVTTFSDLVGADTKKQNVFFSSLTNFMATWGFTGVDIDWEYPAADDRNGRSSDYKNFPKFMSNLKKAMSNYQFGLSVTLPTSYWSVDWFNFMSYDLHGTWDMGNKWTGAYLDAHTNLTEIKTALDLLWRNDIKPSKVNMGMAFYGRSVTLASPITAGVLFNNEISQIINENEITPILYKDAAVKTITWNNDQWVSYDDEDIWKLKAEFAKSQCLGGVLVWSVDNDDSNHTYSTGLAAALGIKLTNNDKSQDQYCRFTNCGEVCPSGFTEVAWADKKKDLMLDSTTCPPGKSQTQTLCCPTSTEAPTCRWRGFHNNECQWTESCHDDLTCPAGYANFVSGTNYNYCCKGDTGPPDIFTNCDWHGHGVTFPNEKYCSTNCPAGSTRVAEQVINTMWGKKQTANTEDCLYGNEAYCCSGAKNASFSSFARRDLSSPEKPTDQGTVLTYLLPIMAVWITSQFPREDLSRIWKNRTTEYGYKNEAANVTTIEAGIYGAVDSWTGTPLYSPNPLLVQTLCNIAESSKGIQRLVAATDVLCLDGDYEPARSSALSTRAVTVLSMDDCSANGNQPTISLIINGILNGELSLHYLRWINAQGRQGHTHGTDRWIVFHLHIQLNRRTFYERADTWVPGVTTLDVYHSQTITRPSVVTRGRRADFRAQYQYTSSYARGSFNNGDLQNYNARSAAIACPINGNRRWYVGVGRADAIRELEAGTSLPTGYAELLNSFGLWMHQQGIFSERNLRRIFPNLPTRDSGFQVLINAADYFHPEPGAFDENWMPDGSRAPRLPHNDGSKMYETEYGELLAEMVKANDKWMVRQYIEIHPKAGLYSSESLDMDVIFIACEYGSLDTLRVLLDHYHTHIDSPDTESLEQGGISLLGIACRLAQLDTVRFLLDSQPPLGTVEPGDGLCETALLSAATSLSDVGFDWERCQFPERSWVRDSVARSEALIHLLLDRGASARDASYQLVARLINAGADVHRRQMPLNQMNNYGGSDLPRDVTALHRGGLFWNAPGIRALLDHRGSNADIADMVSIRDSDGRLPLHWAAMGPDPLAEDMLLENEVLPRIVDTFKLLLEGKQSTVNIQDNLGRTALFYAVSAHAKCISSHSYILARFLCEHGADASLADTDGKTVLHELALASHAGDPMNPALLDLMLSHGAGINHADIDGSTVLHLMAKNLRQVNATSFLISRGADVNARDSQGNTPLHTATMTGVYFARLTREGKTERTTPDERIKLHEEVIAILLEAGGSSLMDQPNAAGKSPRQLLKETRSRWYMDEERMRRINAERASYPDF
ncbi:hypothetical protein BDV38DRAFT_290072 [Aspergillus pseudotamarii]|uniref:chitinase n=1 Tax=Aspergillus pseudotamarii TaxID=132259 RepID=A0A5N6SAA4_ASPPS|nr:uncharacterized protein BDV38DRAFT_290072 [Aspergillus pseudotamarii]KAE8131505.1 hypothetical protein BDV38DRAFT_290072 [Aspergillus pseudotamarii]